MECWITDLIDIVPIFPSISCGGKQCLICKVCIKAYFPFHVTGVTSISVLAPAAGGVPLHRLQSQDHRCIVTSL